MTEPAQRGATTERVRGDGAVQHGSSLEVLRVAFRLGLTSFGGPVAHLGYFHDEYVTRRKWLDEAAYADLVALCQFLPGPASSELGIAVGISRAGLLGGLMAWIGFTLPSAVALTAFALVVRGTHSVNAPWLHGLQFVTAAVVAQAVWQMWRRLAPDAQRTVMALLAAATLVLWSAPATQAVVIVVAGLIGWRLLSPGTAPPLTPTRAPVSRRLAAVMWAMLVALLVGLPVVRHFNPNGPVAVFDSFFRAGALVFGGGHVVLPLLQASVVKPGWVSNGQFLAGYGAAQAVPGPLFTFSAYLGAIMRPQPNGVPGAAFALVAMFLPAFLLVIGTLPFWDDLRTRSSFRAALSGVNAAVVGLLLSALYRPIWTSTIRTPADLGLAAAAFLLLAWLRVPPWLVVLFAAAAGIVVR